jgi:hypothetical protein
MNQETTAPAFSWDDAETEVQNEHEDFLSEVAAQDVPKACSIDQPDCEACQ